jgi:2-amino-4-hydroxy-6-hydroxymethyldihydropteridine diphosphokinase
MRQDDEAPAERVFIGLGANLGQPRASLDLAIAALDQLPGTRLQARSAFYASAPIDAQGPEFINAVAELRTTLQPAALLQALHAIEAAQGRLRPYRNAPRTLDLDLLMFGQRQLDSPTLVLPHPRMHLRAFVLKPLLDLAPELVHPSLGPLAICAAAAADQSIRRLDP